MAGWRKVLTWTGAAGIVLVAVSIEMLFWAIGQGVHCPQCDRSQLGTEYAWWATYFDVRGGTLLAGMAGGVVGALGGARRWPGIAAMLLAGVALGITPM
jgi:hypothetical protein